MGKFCPECGTSNNDDALFCTNCGSPLPCIPKDQEKIESATPETDAIPASEIVKTDKAKPRIKPALIICIAAVAVIAVVLISMLSSGTFDKMSATSKAGKGDYIGALESYEKYLSRSGKESSDAITQAAQYALSAGDADKALMYAKSVQDKSEESVRIEDLSSIALARDAANTKDWNKAISLLENCTDDDGVALLKEYRYNYGVELMSAEKWDAAAEQFGKTDYSDSKELLEKCTFESSVDAHFLKDLESFCYEIIEAGFDYDDASSALTILDPYSAAEFTDPDLQEYAAAFLSDMQSYVKLLSSYRRICYLQKDMCTPFADASDQLIQINNRYPFGSKIWSDISEYFETPEYWKTTARVVGQIADDMSKKASSGPYGREHQFIKVPNNTQYEVEVTFWFYCYDKNNMLYSTDEVDVTLAKGKKTQVIFECDAYTCPTWGYDFFVESYR